MKMVLLKQLLFENLHNPVSLHLSFCSLLILTILLTLQKFILVYFSIPGSSEIASIRVFSKTFKRCLGNPPLLFLFWVPKEPKVDLTWYWYMYVSPTDHLFPSDVQHFSFCVPNYYLVQNKQFFVLMKTLVNLLILHNKLTCDVLDGYLTLKETDKINNPCFLPILKKVGSVFIHVVYCSSWLVSVELSVSTSERTVKYLYCTKITPGKKC